jgi:Spy/CpxP family protein refolding chaperone
MRGRILVAFTLAAVVFGATGLEAFDLPGGRWWENKRLVDHLNLTAEQRERIESMVYSHAEQMIDLNAAVERTKLELERQTKAESVDIDATRRAFAEFQQARMNLETERFEMLLSVRQVLTDPQWTKLINLREQLESIRRNREDGPRRPPARRPGGNRP